MKKHKGEEFEITQADYEQSLRQGADPEHAPLPGKYIGWRRADRLAEKKIEKTRINIDLDSDVIDYFKGLAAQPDAAPYQTQINSALRRVMEADTGAQKSELLKDEEFIKQVAAEVKRLSE
ncbi:MAG: BrnA antitoxin family protein [Blastocatellia bacterium]|nr:BrnA antitoxin family protein [Blastocatellia bacterium]